MEHRCLTDCFDPQAVVSRVGGDLGFVLELIQMFLEDYPALIRELRAAVDQGDVIEAQRTAHKLRGVIGHFHVAKPYETAKQLEALAAARQLGKATPLVDRLAAEVEQLVDTLKQFAAEVIDK